jgi:hypothetical protein
MHRYCYFPKPPDHLQTYLSKLAEHNIDQNHNIDSDLKVELRKGWNKSAIAAQLVGKAGSKSAVVDNNKVSAVDIAAAHIVAADIVVAGCNIAADFLLD